MRVILLACGCTLGINLSLLAAESQKPPVPEPGAALTKTDPQTLVERVESVPALREQNGRFFQPVLLTLRHFGPDTEGSIRLEGDKPVSIRLTNGTQTVESLTRAVTKETERFAIIEMHGQTPVRQGVTLKPVRKLTIYVLPHSHNDIGYTEIQTAVEKKQVNNLLAGMECARKTAGYPEGARFVWNVEVLWGADLYLHRLNEQQRAEFFAAVKNGQVALNGMYLNELTGLCRPEELLRLFQFSASLAERCDVKIDSAMISDVPGCTWGTVTAMAQAGIKYFSVAPNYFDRIGDLIVQWENKPFYWMSPSGKDKVLVWVPFKGYALSHLERKLSPAFVTAYQAQLDKTAYPYDITYIRWSGHGDNAVPDPAICDFIKEWNTKYAYPKFIIASTSAAFRAFEKRYGDKIPRLHGDLTPYWEDGAGSSALETAMNRATADRLTQAETLWTMNHPASYPAAEFNEAWRNVLLYSEHTWGADCSVSDPENQKTKEQWAIKQSYVTRSDAQSRQLLDRAMTMEGTSSNALDIINTTAWSRTDMVVLSPELSAAGDCVKDSQGSPLPSQRLSTKELAFLARDVPPFASRRYTVSAGANDLGPRKIVQGPVLDNGRLHLRVDDKTGGIVELRSTETDGNLVDASSGHLLNEYLFLAGDNLANLQSNGPVKITVKENGPLLGSLLIESSAPGCRSLTREVRLIASLDRVDLINTVDKERAAISSKRGDHQFAQKGGKESVNFAFPFHIPDGDMQLDIPLGMMHPDRDQLPGACKNWFTAGRWLEIANRDYGITWVTLDAPLVEVGDLTARLLGSQINPTVWRNKVVRTQTFYSWVMNNHWGTNYRAYQEGPVVFRYALWPHLKATPDADTRFATGLSQPLIVAKATSQTPATPPIRVPPDEVNVLGMKPSDDGKATIIRLFGASGKDAQARLAWLQPRQLWLSDTSERRVHHLHGTVPVPAWSVVTVRAE